MTIETRIFETAWRMQAAGFTPHAVYLGHEEYYELRALTDRGRYIRVGEDEERFVGLRIFRVMQERHFMMTPEGEKV